jgi:hypothetical protein
VSCSAWLTIAAAGVDADDRLPLRRYGVLPSSCTRQHGVGVQLAAQYLSAALSALLT